MSSRGPPSSNARMRMAPQSLVNFRQLVVMDPLQRTPQGPLGAAGDDLFMRTLDRDGSRRLQ